MSYGGRHCDIGRLTADAKEILTELEMDDYRQLLEKLVAEAREDPIAPHRTKRWYPRYLVWELTLACNMRCLHCGSSAGRARPDELTKDELLRVCDELGELGCERVTLLGGEPLIHPHWEAVARRIRDNGFRANVITNGWTLHRPELCDRIAEAELTIVGISVDGLERSHDKLRNREGSFARIAQGMELLRERGLPVAVPTVVTNDSLDDLPGLLEFLLDKGVKVWQLQIGNPFGRLKADDPVIIRPERLPELFDFILATRASEHRIRVDIADNVGYYSEYEDRGIRQKRPGMLPYWIGCHSGIQSIGIDSNGDVKGCQSMPSTPEFIEGNVRDRPLAEIWNDPEAFGYTRQFELETLAGFCAECHYGPLCKAGCSSTALSRSGNIGDNPMCIHRVLTERDGQG